MDFGALIYYSRSPSRHRLEDIIAVNGKEGVGLLPLVLLDKLRSPLGILIFCLLILLLDLFEDPDPYRLFFGHFYGLARTKIIKCLAVSLLRTLHHFFV